MEYDYEKLGLKMGLEIHQQLNSQHKLFCPCKTELVDDDFDELIQRKLRPTQSELGEIDRAALQESLRGLNFKYENFEKHTCLVENDDEPPHSLNEEALDICITIACLMNMHIVDEFHIQCVNKLLMEVTLVVSRELVWLQPTDILTLLTAK